VTSGGRSNVVTIFVARLTDPAAGARRLHFRVVTSNPDGGREHTQCDPLVARRRHGDLAPRAQGPFGAVAALDRTLVAFRTLDTLRTFRAFRALIALRPLIALRALEALRPIVTLGAIGALRSVPARLAVLPITIAARRWALVVAIIIFSGLVLGAGRFFVAIAIFIVTRAALILFFEA
jgi:hypothetical protein